MSMPISEEELISTIKHSSLSTLLVEGKSDMRIYLWLEKNYKRPLHLDVLSCNGRKLLLSVFNRRGEFVDKKVAFLADKDMWLFSGVPSVYKDIVFTHGYSIENDILASHTVDFLFETEEKNEFEVLCSELCKWFAFEVEEHLAGRECYLDVNVNQIIQLGCRKLNRNYLRKRRFND